MVSFLLLNPLKSLHNTSVLIDSEQNHEKYLSCKRNEKRIARFLGFCKISYSPFKLDRFRSPTFSTVVSAMLVFGTKIVLKEWNCAYSVATLQHVLQKLSEHTRFWERSAKPLVWSVVTVFHSPVIKNYALQHLDLVSVIVVCYRLFNKEISKSWVMTEMLFSFFFCCNYNNTVDSHC